MRYELVYTRRAVKDIQALDSLAQKQLAKRLETFQLAPFQHADKLIHPKLGQYRFRVGDYRVIFDVHGSKLVLLRVGHRREIYR